MEIIEDKKSIQLKSKSGGDIFVSSYYDLRNYRAKDVLVIDKTLLIPGEYEIRVNGEFLCRSIRVEYGNDNINAYKISIINSADYEKKVKESLLGKKISVTIPTYNAGIMFDKVLDALSRQAVEFELVIVDSESTDETTDIINKYIKSGMNIKLIPIKKSEFQHGKTRNYAVSMASGDYVAVLTQDALPYNRYWLYELISPMFEDDLIAGTYGKHIPYMETNVIEKCRILMKFKGLDDVSPVSYFEKYADFEKLPEGKRLFYLDYYSNSSALRKSVWKKIPYPEVPWSEDKAWIKLLYMHGYKKKYCSSSIIFHSHNFGLADLYKRWYSSVKNTSYSGITTYSWYRNNRKWAFGYLRSAYSLLKRTDYFFLRKIFLLAVEFIRGIIIYKAAVDALRDYDRDTGNR